MDKGDTQHLEEYRAYLKALKIRVSTMENLIRPLAAQEKVEGEVPIDLEEADVIHYKGIEHKPTTDTEVMNDD